MNIIRATEPCDLCAMDEAEPKDRLRQARERRGVTRAQLAAKIGRSQSAIRAHENGQNKLSPDMAEIYAAELGVSPWWLLYGVDDLPAKVMNHTDYARVVRVTGEIWERSHFVPAEELLVYTDEDEGVVISQPQYAGIELVAFIVRGDNYSSRRRKYVVAARIPFDAVTLADEVVAVQREGRLAQLGIWKVGARDDDMVTLYRGPTQGEAHDLYKLRRGTPAYDDIIGPVIQYTEVISRVIARDGGLRPEDHGE